MHLHLAFALVLAPLLLSSSLAMDKDDLDMSSAPDVARPGALYPQSVGGRGDSRHDVFRRGFAEDAAPVSGRRHRRTDEFFEDLDVVQQRILGGSGRNGRNSPILIDESQDFGSLLPHLLGDEKKELLADCEEGSPAPSLYFTVRRSLASTNRADWAYPAPAEAEGAGPKRPCPLVHCISTGTEFFRVSESAPPTPSTPKVDWLRSLSFCGPNREAAYKAHGKLAENMLVGQLKGKRLHHAQLIEHRQEQRRLIRKQKQEQRRRKQQEEEREG